MKKDSKSVEMSISKFYSIKSVRMCVVCRKRDLQKNLIRFNVLESKLQLYNGCGRSFYMCNDCLQKDKTYKNIKRFVSKVDNLKEQIEEIIKICQK